MEAVHQLHRAHVSVSESQLDNFQLTLERLNAKAQRFGLPPILASKPREELVRILNSWDAQGNSLRRILRPDETPSAEQFVSIVKVFHYDLTYPIIKLGDWEVIAQIETHSSDTGHLVFALVSDPNATAAIEQYRYERPTCDHCKTTRNRKLTYVLRSGGQICRVGSSCLQDFTGIDPSAVLLLEDLKDVVGRYQEVDLDKAGYWSIQRFPTRDYLAYVLFCIEKFGWSPASSDLDEPTYVTAWNLPRDFKKHQRLAHEYGQARERLLATADQVKQWIMNQVLSPSTSTFGNTSFLLNANTLLSADSIKKDRRHLAIAAGAVAAYLRYLRTEATQSSEHVGTIGEKRAATLTLLSVFSYEKRRFIPSVQFIFRDKAGNQLLWRTKQTPQALMHAKPGDTFDAEFKVKAHSEYKGIRQTVVSHLKVTGPTPSDDQPTASGEEEPSDDEQMRCSF